MKYQSEAAMRADLSKIITDDPALIEATIRQYFSKHKPLVVKTTASGSVKPERAMWGEHSEEGTRALRMREGSDKLGMAIEAMLAGREFTTPENLLWRDGLQPSQFSKFQNSHVRDREKKSVDAAQKRKSRIQAQVVDSSVPCFRCGAAKGCTTTHCKPVNVTQARVNRQWDKEAGHG